MTRKQKKTIRGSAFKLPVFIVALTFVTSSTLVASSKNKIFAQTLVEQTLAKHPELEGIGLGTTAMNGTGCVDIADTDTHEIGEKCDKGELAVIKTGKATVEKERDGYDVTLPFEVSGQMIGAIGLEFKLDQQQTGLVDKGKAIAKEIEDQVPSKSKLFQNVR
jgi:hypothetical protein